MKQALRCLMHPKTHLQGRAGAPQLTEGESEVSSGGPRAPQLPRQAKGPSHPVGQGLCFLSQSGNILSTWWCKGRKRPSSWAAVCCFSSPQAPLTLKTNKQTKTPILREQLDRSALAPVPLRARPAAAFVSAASSLPASLAPRRSLEHVFWDGRVPHTSAAPGAPFVLWVGLASCPKRDR